MSALFAGYEGVHGTHGEPVHSPTKGKWEIKSSARTIRSPVTDDLWRQHLAGERPLGVAPLRADGTTSWGAVDVDEYDDNPLEYLRKVEEAGLKIVPCRSKSGGLHLFVFLAEPAPAGDLIRALQAIAARLGLAEAEIFPKQERVLSDRGDLPNWMVIPYFGSNYGNRIREQVGLRKTGAELTLAEFVAAAEAARMTRDELAALTAVPRRNGVHVNGAAPYADGPPCLEHLASVGIVAPGRNTALLHAGVYWKRKDPNGWRERIEEVNRSQLRPPLEASEVLGIIRSLEKKDYEFLCKQQPMRAHCNSAVCRARPYGVGAEDEWPKISSLSKLDTQPPIWFVDVNGDRLELTTRDLQDYRSFHRACMEVGNRCYRPLKEADWFAIVNAAMDGLVLVEAPKDVSDEGRFQELLEEFLTNRQRGTEREHLLLGRPWESEEDRRHYFRLQDLQRFVLREGVRDLPRGRMTQMVKNLGGSHQYLTIKGLSRNYWWVPVGTFDAAPQVAVPAVKRGEI